MHAKLYLCLTHLDSILSCNQLQKCMFCIFILFWHVLLLFSSSKYLQYGVSARAVQAQLLVQVHQALGLLPITDMILFIEIVAEISSVYCECKFTLHWNKFPYLTCLFWFCFPLICG
jgi:hypothetical protein